MKFVKSHLLLIVLTTAFVINAMDRQILVILQEDIKHDLQLSDTQLGFLSGFAFVAIYVVMGFPLAYLADRLNKRKVLATCMAGWGVMTALCGLAQNYTQLVAARCGVGLGEAGCTPAAHSMIAEAYPASQRATALSVYGSGFYIGSFLGMMLGGWFAVQYGWRSAFFAAAVPPLVLSGLLRFLLPSATRPQADTSSRVSFWASLGTLWRIRAFRWYAFGGAVAAFSSAALATWTPVLLIRDYGMSKTAVGASLGLINGAGGLVTIVLFGALTDYLARRDRRWNLWMVAIILAVSVPGTLLAFSSHGLWTLLAFYSIPALGFACVAPPLISATQQIVPAQLHAMVTATIFFLFNVFGLGLAPMVVGMLSDALTPSLGAGQALRVCMFLLAVPFAIGFVMIAIAARLFPREDEAGSIGDGVAVPVA